MITNGENPIIKAIDDKLEDIVKGISGIDGRLIRMETWQEGHKGEHIDIKQKLEDHEDSIKKHRSIMDTWKGYAFVISVAMSVGTIVGVIIKYL